MHNCFALLNLNIAYIGVLKDLKVLKVLKDPKDLKDSAKTQYHTNPTKVYMKINYMKRSMMLLGAAAVVAAASADYRDVTGLYMKNPAFLPGWQGALTATADGVGEVYNGAANLYQVLRDMPAGEYVLTADAFYRCGTNDYAKENMKDGANHFASLYLGTA